MDPRSARERARSYRGPVTPTSPSLISAPTCDAQNASHAGGSRSAATPRGSALPACRSAPARSPRGTRSDESRRTGTRASSAACMALIEPAFRTRCRRSPRRSWVRLAGKRRGLDRNAGPDWASSGHHEKLGQIGHQAALRIPDLRAILDTRRLTQKRCGRRRAELEKPPWRGSRTVQTFVFPRPRVPLTSSSRPDASSAVRAPVSPVCDARRGAQLLGRQVAYIAALVCERSHRRKEQPLGSSRRAVRQNRLAQLDDDVVAPPRTSISEHESDGARSAAGSGALVDRQQPACDQVLPRLLRWNGYEHLAPHQRQVCWSHIQRDFRRHSEGLAEQKTFGQHGLELTARVFRAWRSYQQEHHNRDQLKAEIAPIQAALRRLLEQAARRADAPGGTAGSRTTCSRSGPRSGHS